MLLFLRTATSFLPTSTLPRRASSITASARRLHYNSLWVQKRKDGSLLKATEKEESSVTSSTEQSDDPWESFRNRNNIRDQVVSAISKDGGIKVTACTSRNIVNDLMMQHTMTEIPIQAMGRTLTCALLMANGMQKEQTVQITLNCKFLVCLLGDSFVLVVLDWFRLFVKPSLSNIPSIAVFQPMVLSEALLQSLVVLEIAVDLWVAPCLVK